jgi:hypothetical protein
MKPTVSFLRDTGLGDYIKSHQRIEVPAPTRDEAQRELGDTLRLMGIGFAVGSFWTALLFGFWR